MTRTRGRALAAMIVFACGLAGGGPATAGAPQPAGPGAALTVRGTAFADDHGREVVLRGFNVSGEVKLAENGGLPYANAADARRSALAMRELTGANAVRFLLSWAAAEPAPGQYNEEYLRRAAEQIGEFADAGLYILIDFHQDLYSRHLFHEGSWYTGDGAPSWVVAAGGYPRESCGICVQWGQNITQNAAVQDAMRDFWHNRVLATAAGPIGVRDAFLRQARATLTSLHQRLSAAQFARILGADPVNEPYAGRYDAGQDSRSWERTVLMPFHAAFRAEMDAAGWQDKPAFIEPNMFWDANLSMVRQTGGFLDAGQLGPRLVFNTHFYDQKALSGVFMWGKARDGQYADDIGAVRARGAALGTATIVSEFGSPVTGYTSGKTPTVLKAMYQSLDSAVAGRSWWASVARSGPVLSATQWQWDIYNGRHHEAMNGNPAKIQMQGDGWNGEDFSVASLDGTGAVRLRVDPRLVDRAYPIAVAGDTLAFTYEDRSRDGSDTLTWNPVPANMPALHSLVGDGQYALLVWRSRASDAPSELHLPQSFPAAATTVLSDLGTLTGVPAAGTPGAPISADGRTLLIEAQGPAGTLHHALVTAAGGPPPSPEARTHAAAELAAWVAGLRFG